MTYHNTIIVVLALMAFTFTSFVAYASDPTQLQDFCVGVNDPRQALFVNGMFCKNTKEATADDFFFKGLNTSEIPYKTGVNVRVVTATQLPGLNTLGISMTRIVFAPYGLNPTHYHPRATELLTVIEGTICVGFVSSSPINAKNKLFAKVLNEGDVFVFPQGLIHFQFNVGKTPAVTISGYSSQDPSIVVVANSVFGSQPPISVDVLTKAFQLDANVVKFLQSHFGMTS